jgi:hypothetical protein
VDSDGRSEAVNQTRREFEAGVGRRVYAPVSALAFAPVELALDHDTLEVDSGRAEVEGDKVLGRTWGAVSEQRALATVGPVQNKME